MIFGFNTDVRHGETVYHVQSEARVGDLLLQTQVFVRGRCIGKHATSYADQVSKPEFSEQHIHELLKAQHRSVLEAVRAGRVEEMLADRTVVDAGGAPSVPDKASNDGLALECISSEVANGVVRMRIRVTSSGKPVHGAQLTSRLALSEDAPLHSQAVTGAEGIADVSIQNPAQAEVGVLVQATHADKSASRKFRLRRSN